MLSVRFGFDEKCIRDIDFYFENVYEEDWLEDDMVKQMILDIDQSRVVSANCIESPFLGQIPPERLSGGVKACICMLKENPYIDLIVCGPNCEKWILEIAKIKDITVGMSGYDLGFDDWNVQGLCLNDSSDILSSHDWVDKMCRFVNEE